MPSSMHAQVATTCKRTHSLALYVPLRPFAPNTTATHLAGS